MQPFSASVDVLRNVLVGTPLPDPLWWDLTRMVGFAALALPPAVWVLGRSIRRTRRTGTIIEY